MKPTRVKVTLTTTWTHGPPGAAGQPITEIRVQPDSKNDHMLIPIEKWRQLTFEVELPDRLRSVGGL